MYQSLELRPIWDVGAKRIARGIRTLLTIFIDQLKPTAYSRLRPRPTLTMSHHGRECAFVTKIKVLIQKYTDWCAVGSEYRELEILTDTFKCDKCRHKFQNITEKSITHQRDVSATRRTCCRLSTRSLQRELLHMQGSYSPRNFVYSYKVKSTCRNFTVTCMYIQYVDRVHLRLRSTMVNHSMLLFISYY